MYTIIIHYQSGFHHVLRKCNSRAMVSALQHYKTLTRISSIDVLCKNRQYRDLHTFDPEGKSWIKETRHEQ
jgi:hypothetical protein